MFVGVGSGARLVDMELLGVAASVSSRLKELIGSLDVSNGFLTLNVILRVLTTARIRLAERVTRSQFTTYELEFKATGRSVELIMFSSGVNELVSSLPSIALRLALSIFCSGVHELRNSVASTVFSVRRGVLVGKLVLSIFSSGVNELASSLVFTVFSVELSELVSTLAFSMFGSGVFALVSSMGFTMLSVSLAL